MYIVTRFRLPHGDAAIVAVLQVNIPGVLWRAVGNDDAERFAPPWKAARKINAWMWKQRPAFLVALLVFFIVQQGCGQGPAMTSEPY